MFFRVALFTVRSSVEKKESNEQETRRVYILVGRRACSRTCRRSGRGSAGVRKGGSGGDDEVRQQLSFTTTLTPKTRT